MCGYDDGAVAEERYVMDDVVMTTGAVVEKSHGKDVAMTTGAVVERIVERMWLY